MQYTAFNKAFCILKRNGVSRYKHKCKCNFIYAHKKSAAFLGLIALKLRIGNTNYYRFVIPNFTVIGKWMWNVRIGIYLWPHIKYHLWPHIKNHFHCTNFQETYDHSINLCSYFIYRILSTSEKNEESIDKISFMSLIKVQISLYQPSRNLQMLNSKMLKFLVPSFTQIREKCGKYW
jgi:hypothetical protein